MRVRDGPEGGIVDLSEGGAALFVEVDVSGAGDGLVVI